jgi:hypothetical protein
VPDDDAFVNVTAGILTDDGLHAGMAEAARAPERRRGWGTVAAELEESWRAFAS